MYKKYRAYVKKHIDSRDALEMLAEECAELGKAALKAIRAYGLSENPTPVTQEQALADMVEETGDVLVVLDLLDLADVYTACNPKWKRWAIRLGMPEVDDE